MIDPQVAALIHDPEAYFRAAREANRCEARTYVSRRLHMPSGIDEAWGKADPAAAKAAGVEVVSLYLSYDDSKNASPHWIRAYHDVGIGVLLNWESVAGAPLEGASRGEQDATEAVGQVRQLIAGVGYSPRSVLAIPFSCDTDTSTSQRHGPIRAYYANTRRVTHAAGYRNGCYGEADLCEYLAGQGLTDMEWQTYAWSGGRLDPSADFYQYSNDHHIGGGSVDYDRVVHATQLGAWWPPDHPLNTPNPDVPAPVIGAPDMFVYRCGRSYYQFQAGARVRHVAADYARNMATLSGRPVGTVTRAMHKRIVANQADAAKGR